MVLSITGSRKLKTQSVFLRSRRAPVKIRSPYRNLPKWCSPAIEIRFMTGDLKPALRLRGDGLTSAAYSPRPEDPFVRIEVVDAQIQSAWSQPFFIDPDWRP